jgi:hypothetical protein
VIDFPDLEPSSSATLLLQQLHLNNKTGKMGGDLNLKKYVFLFLLQLSEELLTLHHQIMAPLSHPEPRARLGRRKARPGGT